MHVPPSLRCRHCGAELTGLQRRLDGCCGAAPCRHQAGQDRLARLTRALGGPALAAAARLPGGQGAVLLWLRQAPSRSVPLPPARRESHRAHLQRLVDEAAAAAQVEVPPAAPDPPPAGTQEGQLCAQCGGHCCGLGATSHAFIDLPLLLRWQHSRPGSTLQDAAEDYLRRLPPQHVEGSCVYHTDGGCAQPRLTRADICNTYACTSLRVVQQDLAAGSPPPYVAVTVDGDRATGAALIRAGGTLRLEPPGPAP